jgi:hypothetical protein
VVILEDLNWDGATVPVPAAAAAAVGSGWFWFWFLRTNPSKTMMMGEVGRGGDWERDSRTSLSIFVDGLEGTGEVVMMIVTRSPSLSMLYLNLNLQNKAQNILKSIRYKMPTLLY